MPDYPHFVTNSDQLAQSTYRLTWETYCTVLLAAEDEESKKGKINEGIPTGSKQQDEKQTRHKNKQMPEQKEPPIHCKKLAVRGERTGKLVLSYEFSSSTKKEKLHLNHSLK